MAALSTEQRLAALEASIASLNMTTLDKFDALHPDNVPDSGDTAWILTSTALVLMMTIPGLALFYGGMTRAENVLNTVMQSFAITCLISMLWFMMGYSLAFGNGLNPFVGGSERFWLMGVDNQSPLLPASMSGTIPESVFMMFQCTFAVITCALITGSFAERMKFSSTLIFVTFWHLLVYCPIAHWEWHPEGFLWSIGSLDFAGGDVVHISSGVAGLVSSIIVGGRKSFKAGEEVPPHNLVLTVMGASLLWVGWFGFNAGSAVAANGNAGMAMVVTHISASVSGFTWMVVEWALTRRPTVLGIVSGAVMGLVMITPAAGYVDQTGAFFMGLSGGVIGYFAIKLKHALGFDDALDAFGVHGIGGIVGGILTGFFANPAVGGAAGCFYGNCAQLGPQFAGIGASAGWSAIMTAILLWAIDWTIGLRVTDEHEEAGLDYSIHGERAYGHAEAAAPSKMSMSSAQPMQAMPVLSSEEQPTYFIQQVPQQGPFVQMAPLQGAYPYM